MNVEIHTTKEEMGRHAASDGAAFDRFGEAVAMSGDVAVVGAYRCDEPGGDSGAVYVLRFDGTTWNQEQKLVASDNGIRHGSRPVTPSSAANSSCVPSRVKPLG